MTGPLKFLAIYGHFLLLYKFYIFKKKEKLL